MVRKEGLTIAGGYGVFELLQKFGSEGGGISPEMLTQLTDTVNLPTMFVIGAILWYFRKEKDDKPIDLTQVICPYAPKKD